MKAPLTVLLIDDEKAEREAIKQCANFYDDVEIICDTNRVDRAIEYTRDYLPDAVILELELFKGRGDGIGFLQELNLLSPRPFPYILVTTNNTSAIVRSTVRQLGADFVKLKSQTDYSAESVINHLRCIKSQILAHRTRQLKIGSALPEAPAERRRRLISRINSELNHIGISPKLVGRAYIVDSVLLIYDGARYNICEEIARRYKKSPSSVERAMQNAINSAWRLTDIEDLQRLYTAKISSDKGVPTLTEFLHYYANRLKNDY